MEASDGATIIQAGVGDGGWTGWRHFCTANGTAILASGNGNGNGNVVAIHGQSLGKLAGAGPEEYCKRDSGNVYKPLCNSLNVNSFSGDARCASRVMYNEMTLDQYQDHLREAAHYPTIFPGFQHRNRKPGAPEINIFARRIYEWHIGGIVA